MDQEKLQKQLNTYINRVEDEISLMYAERLIEILKILKELHTKVTAEIEGDEEEERQISWTEVNKFRRIEKELERIAGGELDEIDEKIVSLYGPVASTILSGQYYVYTEMYLRSVYLFEFGGNVSGMDVSLPSKEQIAAILAQPIDKIKLKPTLNRQRRQTLERVRLEIAKSIQSGEGYNKAAERISQKMEMSERQARRVARTEGKRAMQQAGLSAAQTAEDAGALMEKVWQATLDFKTRDTHQDLDGETKPLHEPFSSSGCEGQAPTLFVGAKSAGENINCRCSIIYKVNGILPAMRRARRADGSTEVIKYVNYQDWKAALE